MAFLFPAFITLQAVIQSEHKVFPWLQTFTIRKLRGVQTYFLPLLKLVYTILCHVFIVQLLYNLKAKLTDAFATITEDMLEKRGEKLIID
jgi:hypothetical protein